MARVAGRVVSPRAVVGVFAGAFVIAVSPLQRVPVPPAERILIRHVSVIAGNDEPMAQDMSVLIDSGRLIAIAPSSKEQVGWGKTRGARVVDGRGRYLIPGLWDMHAHIDDVEMLPAHAPDAEKVLQLPLFVLEGVTGVRDMGGRLHVLLRWRDSIAAGALLGPRIIPAGPLLDGPVPMWPGSIAISDTVQARRVVDSLQREGAAFLKVYSLLSRESFFAIAREARRIGMPFAGHVPFTVSLSESSDSGQKSQEHLLGVPDETGDLRAAQRAESAAGAGGLARYIARTRTLLDTYDSARAAPLYARLAENHTWQTPTLINTWLDAFGEPDSISSRRMRYMPRFIRLWWNPSSNPHARQRTPAFVALSARMMRYESDVIRQMHGRGVRIVTGTDQGGNPHSYPGFSVHDELALFVRAGLTPLQALQTATRNAAELAGLSESVGTIVAGKDADLVLLDANPLEDIANVARINAVIVRGRLIDSAERMRRLEQLSRDARD